MNAIRNTLRSGLLTGLLAAAALPALAAAPEPAPAAAPDQGTEQRLEAARQRLDAAAREVAELSGQMAGQMGRRFNFNFSTPDGAMPPRAMLGVAIRPETDKGGALVGSISPGGPAAEAGIRQGDVITSVGGHDLSKEGNPGRALVEKMNELQPDLKVQVGLLRDGRKLTVDVMPRPAPHLLAQQMRERFRNGPMGMPGFPGPGGLTNGPQLRQFMLERENEAGTRFEGIEFATLSERLGGYFGVKQGVLVVRAGANSPWKLQDGDVILAIDGREPDSAQHAGRILRSYQAGEKLTLKVQRDRKAQNIEVTAPRDGRRDGARDERAARRG
ncbi:MAG: PDZ domain-containing protein [Steroidobacteraceae bacterium]